MTWLLDGNVLVAIDSHVFHERVRAWFDALNGFASHASVTGRQPRISTEGTSR